MLGNGKLGSSSEGAGLSNNTVGSLLRTRSPEIETRAAVEGTEQIPAAGLKTALSRGGDYRVTNRAHAVMRDNDEDMIWWGKPSPVLLMGLAFKYAIALSLAGWVADSIRVPAIFLVALLVAVVHVGISYLQLRSTQYRLSTQRLEIQSGLLNQLVRAYEVHHLGGAIVHKPMVLRLFQRGNLAITSHGIVLRGIRDAAAVRDLLRNAGQTESERVDKIRWR